VIVSTGMAAAKVEVPMTHVVVGMQGGIIRKD
jgi:hypothetical protein